MARRSLKIKQGQVTAREEGKTENLNEIEVLDTVLFVFQACHYPVPVVRVG